MVVLGVDSATADAVVGVTADGEVVSEAQVRSRRRRAPAPFPGSPPGDRELRRCGGRLGARSTGSQSGSGRAHSRACASASRPRERSPRRAGPDCAGRHAERPGAGRLCPGGGRRSAGASVDRRAPRRGLRGPGRGGRVRGLAPLRGDAGPSGGSGAETRSRAFGGRGRGATIRRTAGGRRRHGCPARGPDPPTRREARVCDRGGGGRGVTGLDPTPVSETARCKEMA